MAFKPEKLSLEQLLRLVDQLSPGKQEELRIKLNDMAKNQTSLTSAHPFMDSHINIDSLAAEQGVPKRTTVKGLKGDFWPPDEDLDEFVTTLRMWRQESSGRK
jgi:hypothetical protein